MSELYFRLGEMKGFTAIDLAGKKEGFATPIRELLQNSLDASREANNKECEINIYIETISKAQIPHIVEYERVLASAINTHTEQGSFNRNSQRVVASIQQALRLKDISVLMFSDNGTGMPQKRMEAILKSVSIKGDEEADVHAVGSFGLGHLSSYWLSSLRYVLYATKYKDENGAIKQLFTGSPILAGYKDADADRGNRGRIIKENPSNERGPEFVYLERSPDFVSPQLENLTATGTVVIILGLSEPWGENAEYAICSNFFHAIARTGLSIKIHQKNQKTKSIDTNAVESLIDNEKDSKRAMGDKILSGKATYQVWKTVTGKDTKKSIKLENGDTVYVCIETDKDADSTIVLVRNGMLIARHDSMLSSDIDGLRKKSDYEPFTAVIDVDSAMAPKLFELVKGAEGPYHNELMKNRLHAEEEQELKESLKQLSGEIERYLEKIDRKSIDLPLFPVSGKAETQVSGGEGSSGQDDTANKISRPKSERKKSGSGDGEGRPKPVVVIRNLQSKKAMRYTDEGKKFEVRLRVIPGEVDAKDDVYLSVCLAEDNDNEEANNGLDFISVEINGKPIGVPANKSQVNLGQLKQAQQYDIIAEVEKPNEIAGDMKVALQPILGLKQRKKTKD